MSQAEFTIVDTTGNASEWEESSPEDPTPVSVPPYGRVTIHPNTDNGPWTVCLKSYNGAEAQGGMIFDHNPAGTTATICLNQGSVGMFTVTVPDPEAKGD